jgi:hypothetical protein
VHKIRTAKVTGELFDFRFSIIFNHKNMQEKSPTEKRESNSGALERAKNWMRNHEKAVILTAGLMMGGVGGGFAEKKLVESNDEAIQELIQTSPELSGVEFTNETFSESTNGDVSVESAMKIAGKTMRVRVLITDEFKSLSIQEEAQPYGNTDVDMISKHGAEPAIFIRKDKNGLTEDSDLDR